MPYIGNIPAEKYASYDVQHITTSATSSYVLDKNVANENEIRVVLNNIIQQPGASYAYTASANTLTLSAATTSSDKLYVVFTGKAVQTVTPPPSSVGLAQLNATGSPGTNTFLRGDNSWATPSDTSLTLNNNAASRVVVGTGTTNTMDAQANLTYDGTTLLLSQASPILKVLPTTNGNDGVIELCGRSTDGSPTENRTQIKGEAEGSTANTKMTFHVENASGVNERMSINSSGIIGVGANGSSADLGVGIHVKTADSGASVDADGDELVLEGTGNTGLSILGGTSANVSILFGDVDVNNAGQIYYYNATNSMRFLTNATEHFRIASDGTLTATDTSIGSNSDSRVKKNITNFTYDLAKFKQFQPKTFDWKNPTQHNNADGNRGFVAQDIQAIDDYWVGEIEIKEGTLDYDLIPADENGVHKSLTSKLGKKDAMYISVINQLITRIEALEG